MLRPIIAILMLSMVGTTQAHRGNVNAEGCHSDIKNGTYHCHKDRLKTQSDKGKKKYSNNYKKYNRKDWVHWIDSDSDCQNTRAEVLIKASYRNIVKFKRNKGCLVTWGKWKDSYTGKTFLKASNLDIDHIVPLYNSHLSSGANWSKSKKRTFANDFENLIAVEDDANQEKGAQSPDQWMPPNKSYHCTYVKKWQYIKDKYELTYTSAEKAKINQVLAGCSD
ncbi:MAG: HNH endonuclease [Endozoicomonadaceae bacterium]|nr:HNH endonuclease [Endozoicomonadaceae bacterium]